MARVNVYGRFSSECRGQPVSIGGRARNNYIDALINTETCEGEAEIHVGVRMSGTLTAADRRQAKDDTRMAYMDVVLPNGGCTNIIVTGHRDYEALVRNRVRELWEELRQRGVCMSEVPGWLLSVEEAVGRSLAEAGSPPPTCHFNSIPILRVFVMNSVLALLAGL